VVFCQREADESRVVGLPSQGGFVRHVWRGRKRVGRKGGGSFDRKKSRRFGGARKPAEKRDKRGGEEKKEQSFPHLGILSKTKGGKGAGEEEKEQGIPRQRQIVSGVL